MRKSRVTKRELLILCAWGALAATGCGGPRHVPVSGRATVNGKPLAGLVISFNADPEKGNDARVSCVGRIGADGRYSLISDDGTKVTKGARLGWYKITVSAPDNEILPVHKKYTDFRQTDLSVEVVAEPGPNAYDLEFAK